MSDKSIEHANTISKENTVDHSAYPKTAEQSWLDFYEEAQKELNLDAYQSGDFDDPDNPRTPLGVLDSIVHAYGDPAYLEYLEDIDRGVHGEVSFAGVDAYYLPPYSKYVEQHGFDWWNPYDWGAWQQFKGKERSLHATNFHDVVEELGHDVQFMDEKYKAGRGDFTYKEGGRMEGYEDPGHLEHEAHSKINPKSWDLIIGSKTKDANLIADIMNSNPYREMDASAKDVNIENAVDINRLLFDSTAHLDLDGWNLFWKDLEDRLDPEAFKKIENQYTTWLNIRHQADPSTALGDMYFSE